MFFNPHNSKLKKLARELRKNSTLSEVLLWKNINAGKMMGYDFHRQKPIDNYIVDFFCQELMLAIEIDGNSHYGKYKKDVKRQKRLESLGIRFLRIGDKDIKKNLDGVLHGIKGWITEHTAKA